MKMSLGSRDAGTTGVDFSGCAAGNMALVGGNLALDFVNTVDWRLSSTRRQEWLTSYPDFVAWALHAGVLGRDEAEGLVRRAEVTPGEAETALHTILAVREALFHLLDGARRRVTPAAHQLAVFNALLGRALAHFRLIPDGPGFAWDLARVDDSLEYPLYPVAKAAAELLVSPVLLRVRQCADEDCGWLFVDTSKNGSRRWCTMQSCGNRAKARRHYRRTRGKPETEDTEVND